MKKFFALMIAVLFSAVCFGQISISTQGSSRHNDYIVKGLGFNIKCVDSIYTLNVKDMEGTNFIHIKLGANPNEACNSLSTLYNWFVNARTKDYIEFTSEGKKVTMYKYTSSVPYFSYEDVDYIKNYLTRKTMQGVFGTKYRNRENDAMIGYVDYIDKFQRAIEKIQESSNNVTENNNIETYSFNPREPRYR